MAAAAAAVEMTRGYTAFDSPPAPTYRFQILSEAEKISIWLENLQSKKQWRTDDLDTQDFVTTMNSIPGASMTDYVAVSGLHVNLIPTGLQNSTLLTPWMHGCMLWQQLFKDTLGYLMDEDNLANAADGVDKTKIRRSLIKLESGELELELSVKLRALESAWSAKYRFLLKPVALDRVDIMEAKLRDVEQQVANSESKLCDVQDQVAAAEAKLRAVEEQVVKAETKLQEVEATMAKKTNEVVHAQER